MCPCEVPHGRGFSRLAALPPCSEYNANTAIPVRRHATSRIVICCFSRLALSSPLTSPTVLILVPRSQGLSVLYGVHTSIFRASVRRSLPGNPKSGHPRRDQVSDRNRKYPNLDVVRQDLELCFENAKKYNVKDGPIWKDTKHLHVCLRRKSVVYATQLISFRHLSTRNTPGGHLVRVWLPSPGVVGCKPPYRAPYR